MGELQKKNAACLQKWGMAAYALLIFGCMWRFGTLMEEESVPGFSIILSLVVTGYMLMIGCVIEKRFQIRSGAVFQLLTVFLLGHFLPFLWEEVGNGHLFYGNTAFEVYDETVPALINYILCFWTLFFDRKKLELWGRILWNLAVGVALFVNPFQGVILISLFGVRLFFALTEGLFNRIRTKKAWNLFKDFLVPHWEKLLWILVWLPVVALQLFRTTQDAAGSTGLMDAVRTWRSSAMNLYPLFLESVKYINIAALVLALWRFAKKKETRFLFWQVEALFCMGATVICLVLLCTVFGDRYLVNPEVMLVWMGWLMLMTVSSLAYIVKIIPKAQYLLPLLVYLVFCETFLHFTTYAKYGVSLITG